MIPKPTLARFLIKLNYEKNMFVTASDYFLHTFCQKRFENSRIEVPFFQILISEHDLNNSVQS